MIYYAEDIEAWIDENDSSFKISMTPENSEELNKEFSSQEEFYEYYTN